jgi:hypothetical protein
VPVTIRARRSYSGIPHASGSPGTGTTNVVTMIRTLGIILALTGVHLVSLAPAAAQEVTAQPAVDLCPSNALRIYFASGAVTVSPQTEALIGKIGETASSCAADHLDLIAHFDTEADGKRAVAVALERLALITDDLIAKGISPDRIRIAVRAVKTGEVASASLNQIDVMFRKAETNEAAAEPAEPARSTVRNTAPSDAI